jgi:hypothetical protein
MYRVTGKLSLEVGIILANDVFSLSSKIASGLWFFEGPNSTEVSDTVLRLNVSISTRGSGFNF